MTDTTPTLKIEAFKIPLVQAWIEKYGYEKFLQECERLAAQSWRVK